MELRNAEEDERLRTNLQSTTDDFKEELLLTVRELLTRGVTRRSINIVVNRAVRQGAFR